MSDNEQNPSSPTLSPYPQLSSPRSGEQGDELSGMKAPSPRSDGPGTREVGGGWEVRSNVR